MGLFDLFKSNKNIITDNGTNYIYYDDGKGSIKEKFSKINGVLNGDYIEYNRNGTFISKTYKNGVIPLTEEEIYLKNRREEINTNIKVEISKLKIIDDLISEISGIFLLVQMENSKIDYYSAIIEEKYTNKFDEDYIKFYLYTKRNYFIKQLIEYNLVATMEIGESFDEIKTENYYNKRFTEHIINYSDNTFNFDIRETIKSNPTPSNIVKKYILEKLFVNFDVNSKLRINYDGIGIIKEIFNQESILFGLNFNTYKLIYEIIKKKSSREFLRDIQDNNNIEMHENLSEMMLDNENVTNNETQEKPNQKDVLAQKVVNEILSLCNNNRVNQEDIKNYKWVKSNEVEKMDSNKILIEKNTKFIDDFQRTSKVISKLDEEEALKHLVIGISKYEIENYEGALDDYKKSIELNPNNARTYLEIGNAKLKLNDYKGAILDYSKSIELDSNHADTYHNRSIAKSKLADYQGVIDDCTKTIEIDNNYTRAYFNRGTAYANLQEFMEAIGDMNSVIELEPHNSNAFKNRGICMYEFEQYDSALKDLNKAMELDPNSNAYITIDKIKEELLNIEVESTNKIIKTVLTNKDFKYEIENFIKKEKVKNFELTINIIKWYGHTPYKYIGKFDGYNFRANISHVCKWGECEHNYEDINELLNDIKDYEIEELHKYLDIEIIPEDDGFELGNIKWEEGTPDEFIEKMKEEWDVFDIMDNGYEEEIFDIIYKEGAIIDGIRIQLSNDDSTFEISWEYSKENEENDKVVSSFKHTKELNNDFSEEAMEKVNDAFNNNSKSYEFYENGQYQEGINSVKLALEIFPEYSNFLDTLALGYYYLGDYKLAIQTSNNCIEIDIDKGTENAENYTTRAKINIKLNQIEIAIEDLKKALELDPEYGEAFELLMNLKQISTSDFTKIKDAVVRDVFSPIVFKLYLKQVSKWIEEFNAIESNKQPISKPDLIFLKIQLSLVLELDQQLYILPLYFELCKKYPDFKPKEGEVLGTLLLKEIKKHLR